MNYRQILNRGTKILKENFIDTANIDAEILLSISLKKSREKILLNLEDKLNKDQINEYLGLINRRNTYEPISLMIGRKFFWKNEFYVNKNVLTPRFETELLIEEVLKIYKHSENISVIDIGLGTGCILISLLKEKKKWRGTGVEMSNLALRLAKTNAKIQQVYNRIKFINSDIDKIYSGKYDLIVTNPPYINNIDYNNLNSGVKNFEPKMALYGGRDGLDIIEKVIRKSKLILKNNGLIAIEIGLGQHYNVAKLLEKNGFYIFKTIKDYQKIKRCILAKKINEKF
ncbi:peptide chain release factor N(5)-glutamine methyltransferase [Candidatus Pelagibacter sp.]|nr:peptide chain release factor N(5)-glutamine methyltransferase [Candidatus Pelagibacter sp.]